MKNGLIIGYGSIGRYHAKIASDRYTRIAIADSNPDARASAESEYPAAVVVSGLDDLAAAGWDWSDTLATVATWGPSHSDIVSSLIEHGVKQILCEKPLSNSVASGAQMLELARHNGVTLAVHHHRRYSGLAQGLADLTGKYGLGEPMAVYVQGGATGLVTNGIHQLDWASEIFGAWPKSVVSTAEALHINPRSPDLGFYGGTATWRYSGGRDLSISYTNLSSVSQSIHVYYRNAIADIDRLAQVRLRGRSHEDIDRFPAVTRTGEATDVLFEGAVPGFREVTDATSIILDELEAGEISTFPPEGALTAVGACIGALASGRDGVRINLPIHPESQLGREEWPIS